MLNVKKGIESLDQAIKEIVNPEKGVMINAWPIFSEYTGGLRMREFTIFCGATGSGKTQWLANMAMNLIQQGTKVFVAPVETGDSDFVKRMISVLAGKDLNTGEALSPSFFSKQVGEHLDHFTNHIWLSTHDNRVDIEEMVQTLQFMQEVNGVQVAILDNLNFFMKPTKSSDTILETDRVIHEFVMLAKKIPIHIILVMHPKKTEGGKIISEFDIKGSSTAVQEASNVLLMNRPNEKEVDDMNIHPFSREFVFRKLRKRGFYVGEKFHLDYRAGKYVERSEEVGRERSDASRDTGIRKIQGR